MRNKKELQLACSREMFALAMLNRTRITMHGLSDLLGRRDVHDVRAMVEAAGVHIDHADSASTVELRSVFRFLHADGEQ